MNKKAYLTQPILHTFDLIDSTNEEGKRQVAAWQAEWQSPQSKTTFPDTVLIAHSQTRGRGRLGRHWYSPPGNLYMTLVKSLPVPMTKLPQLSLVIGLALHRALKKLIPSEHHIAVKWPNDILVNGKKIAGILIETDCDSQSEQTICYIGIGLNRLSSPETMSYPTCSLLDFIPDPPEILGLGNLVLEEINPLLSLWMNSGLRDIREEWLWSAYGLGKPISAKIENGFVLYGRFVSLSLDGALIIEDDDQHQHTVLSSEIQYMV